MNARTPIEAAQGTPNWHAARRGHLTGSRMADAMSYLTRKTKNGEKGDSSAERKKYMAQLVAERMTEYAFTHFVTKAMEDGLEREPMARAEYEITTGLDVRDAGFIKHPTIAFFGATPDGFVGADGLAEFKCPTHSTYIDWLIAGVVPAEHKPQMIAEAVCAQREWVDFVAYHPDFGARKLFVRRFTPTLAERQMVEEEAQRFLEEVDAMFDAVCQIPMIE